MMVICNDENFATSVFFSDKATFSLNETANRYNLRHWSNENPQHTYIAHN